MLRLNRLTRLKSPRRKQARQTCSNCSKRLSNASKTPHRSSHTPHATRRATKQKKENNHAQHLSTHRPGLGRRQCRPGRVVLAGAQDGPRGLLDEGGRQALYREEVSQSSREPSRVESERIENVPGDGRRGQEEAASTPLSCRGAIGRRVSSSSSIPVVGLLRSTGTSTFEEADRAAMLSPIFFSVGS
jgi:hypothetical protein